MKFGELFCQGVLYIYVNAWIWLFSPMFIVTVYFTNLWKYYRHMMWYNVFEYQGSTLDHILKHDNEI